MEQIVIQKPGGGKVRLYVKSAEQVCEYLGQDVLNISVTSATPLNILIGCYMDIFGSRYIINNPPKLLKANDRQFDYEIVMEGPQYQLIKVQYLDVDAVGFSTGTSFALMGDLEDFIRMIIRNLDRVYGVGVWTLGEFPTDTLTQNIDFANETCLQALQGLCATYETAFDIERHPNNTYTLNIRKNDAVLPDIFRYGRARGLYTLERNNVSSKNIITRLYAYGAQRNIPANYRGGSTRLKMPIGQIHSEGAPYIDDLPAQAKYGIVEGSVTFDDVYPQRTGTVTAIYADELKFSDGAMPFNLDAKDGNNNALYRLPGIAPKVVFITGNLAGYQFEVGPYNNSEKTYTLVRYTDERGLELPSKDLAAFKIQVGDKYKLVDVNMPQIYISSAEMTLLQKAQDYLAQNSYPRIQWALQVDHSYISRKAPDNNTIINYFRLGNLLHVVDADLEVDGKSPVIGWRRDLINHYKYDLTVGEEKQEKLGRISMLRKITKLADPNSFVKNPNLIANSTSLLQTYSASAGIPTEMHTLKFFIGDGTPPKGYVNKPAGEKLQDTKLVGAQIFGFMLIDNAPMEWEAEGVEFDPNGGELDFKDSTIGELWVGNKIVIQIFY